MNPAPVPPQILGALNRQQQLFVQVVQDLPEAHVNRRFHDELPSIGWLLGRAVYLELHLLRGQVAGDNDLAGRVRHLFAYDAASDNTVDAALPPKDHLLNWALEAFDTHLTLLANPGRLPDHPWMTDAWLPAWLVQAEGQLYERMMQTLQARTLQLHDEPGGPGYRVQLPLEPLLPTSDGVDIAQGHYRIGAREGVVFDNEQPAQMVELASFRVAREPVSNGAYLAFMQAGGYRQPDWWDDAGKSWLGQAASGAPWHWRRDGAGGWYGVGLTGPLDLIANDPVSGLCHHEASAFARWAASLGGDLVGAVLQHEYQWEVAARTGAIEGFGRVWEWCSQPLSPYDQHRPPADPELADDFREGLYAQRGGCLHTQPALRRASLRQGAPAGRQAGFCGARLVFPPGTPFWERESREAQD